MTLIRLSSHLAALAAVSLMVSSGCVRRTIVRDRGAIGDNEPREITMGDGKNPPPKKEAAPAQVVVVQPTTPAPPPPVETRPPPPGTEYVWVDGRYEWRNNRWEWNSGHWERRT